jgi:hypothetical protein
MVAFMDLEQTIHDLHDRSAIRDLLGRYCRAVDRRDFTLLESLYHADARDCHMDFEGDLPEFLAYVRRTTAPLRTMHHLLGQTSIDLRGDTARCETYLSSHSTFLGGELWDTPAFAADQVMLVTVTGRYLDTITRRNDEWRFYRRLFMVDFRHVRPITDRVEDGIARSGSWPDDPVYGMSS